jgi:hypothetical protein
MTNGRATVPKTMKRFLLAATALGVIACNAEAATITNGPNKDGGPPQTRQTPPPTYSITFYGQCNYRIIPNTPFLPCQDDVLYRLEGGFAIFNFRTNSQMYMLGGRGDRQPVQRLNVCVNALTS